MDLSSWPYKTKLIKIYTIYKACIRRWFIGEDLYEKILGFRLVMKFLSHKNKQKFHR